MRIGVLPPHPDGPDTALENYFLLHALRTLLGDHELVRLDGKTEKPQCDRILCVGARFLEDGFWDQWILGQPEKIAAVGVSIEPSRVWNERTSEKLRCFAKQGSIGVVDEVSRKKIEEVVDAQAVRLAGSPALFSSSASFVLSRPAKLFFPAKSDPAFDGKHKRTLRRLLKRFYRRLNEKGRALFMVGSSAEFDFGAVPGMGTLFEPLHPQIHLKAVSSAAAVFGFHPTALMAAIASGVPAVLIGNDPTAKNAVQSAGIPFLEINPNTDPGELAHRADEIVRKYPWETIHEKCAGLRGAFLKQLQDFGLAPHEDPGIAGAKSSFGNSPKDGIVHVASILGESDLSTFLGFFENLYEVGAREVHHHVLALDRATESAVQKTFAGQHIYLYRASDVWPTRDISGLLGPADRRRLLLKPRFLSMLIKKCDGPVLFCDPSLFFYKCPSALLGYLDGSHTVLFPRWVDSLSTFDQECLFDTSLIVAGHGSEELLNWWAEAAQAAVVDSPGIAAKQEPSFLSLLPHLFNGVRIYRAADQNVSRQCFQALGVRPSNWDGEPLRLSDGRPVFSLEWQGEDSYGFLDIKIVWDQLSCFFSGENRFGARDQTTSQVLIQQKRHWSDLRNFLKGHALFCRHFPWFAHQPNRTELGWFVSGSARWLGRWIDQGLHAGRTSGVSSGTSGSPSDWIRLLQSRLFPAAPASDAPPAPPLAKSA